jgi:hypothetical protein
MFRTTMSAAAAVAVSLTLSFVQAAEPEPISNPKAALRHILPAKRDLVWTKVPWRATLWDAVIDANREKKPILLWAMNGHALACT